MRAAQILDREANSESAAPDDGAIRKNYAVTFGKKTFRAPEKFREQNITHALCGVHRLRGAEVLRWMKADLIDDPEKIRLVTHQMSALYGSALKGVRLVQIKEIDAGEGCR